MRTLQVQIEDDLVEKLDHFVPRESNQQALFVIRAIRQALWDAEERATAKAYRQQPDRVEDQAFDPELWESGSFAGRPRQYGNEADSFGDQFSREQGSTRS